MKKNFPYVFLIIFCTALFVSCEREARVIPKRKLSKIYAEMYIADQWAIVNPGVKKKADTMSYYEPIFEKYGYDLKDYRKSVEYYLEDPDKYSQLLKKTAEIIRDEVKDIRAEQDKINAARSIRNKVFSGGIPLYRSGSGRPFKRVKVLRDTIGRYNIEKVEFDTLYSGPVIIVRNKNGDVSQPALVGKME